MEGAPLAAKREGHAPRLCEHFAGDSGHANSGWKWLALALLLFVAVDKLGVGGDSGGDADLGGPASLGARYRALGGTADSAHSGGPAKEHASAESADQTAERMDASQPGSAELASTHASKPSSSHHGEHAHPHEAMFFLVLAFLIGTMVLHLTRLPLLHGLQQTVVLFVLGCCCSLVMQGAGVWNHLGAVGRSYRMWMIIDPHLVLFTLLPPLLAGDAMTINTNLAQKVVGQCLYLAGPGVLINAMLTALFLWAYLSWPFLLCLTAGSILCATDPVAVVALLKELGASPVLTVQIQGESLLNDGTAIVLYLICYGALQGESYSGEYIVVFLVEKALCAVLLGMAVGGLFFLWIRAAKNKFDHNSGMIQVSLTICCAYSSFIVAEGLFHVSGVLATVAASLLLAHKMWPEIVDHEMMATIWHTFEYLGNTVIFFLAGALTGEIMLRTPAVDYLHLLVLYTALVAIRALLILPSRPLLAMLAKDFKPVPLPDALVMVWGGLRGAVGLALAIHVSLDRAGGELSSADADRVLFYVGGVALLTLVINATTCPALVQWLRMTQLPEAKRQLMLSIHQQMVDQLDVQDFCPATRRALSALLQDVEHHLLPKGPASGLSQDLHSDAATASWVPRRLGVDLSTMETIQRLIVRHCEAQERFKTVTSDSYESLLKILPQSRLLAHWPKMVEIAREDFAKPALVRVVNTTFLSLVHYQYWQQNKEGEVSTQQARTLFSSVESALSTPCLDLDDLEFIAPEIDFNQEGCSRSSVKMRLSMLMRPQDQAPSLLHSVMESTAFNVFIGISIVVNFVIVMADYKINPHNHDDMIWFALEVLFNAIFTIEIVLRIADSKCRFFISGWNLIDLFLVIVGLVGVTIHSVLFDRGSFGTQETQLTRIIRVFKILRILRVLRFVRITVILGSKLQGKTISIAVAEHMEKLVLLLAFIRAHTQAQEELLRYFGSHGEATTVEVARCILQSQIAVYQAVTLCVLEQEHLDEWLLDELRVCRSNLQAAREMESFLFAAKESGVLSASEAESFVHTVHHHMHRFSSQIENLRSGRADKPLFTQFLVDSEAKAPTKAGVSMNEGKAPSLSIKEGSSSTASRISLQQQTSKVVDTSVAALTELGPGELDRSLSAKGAWPSSTRTDGHAADGAAPERGQHLGSLRQEMGLDDQASSGGKPALRRYCSGTAAHAAHQPRKHEQWDGRTNPPAEEEEESSGSYSPSSREASVESKSSRPEATWSLKHSGSAGASCSHLASSRRTSGEGSGPRKEPPTKAVRGVAMAQQRPPAHAAGQQPQAAEARRRAAPAAPARSDEPRAGSRASTVPRKLPALEVRPPPAPVHSKSRSLPAPAGHARAEVDDEPTAAQQPGSCDESNARPSMTGDSDKRPPAPVRSKSRSLPAPAGHGQAEVDEPVAAQQPGSCDERNARPSMAGDSDKRPPAPVHSNSRGLPEPAGHGWAEVEEPIAAQQPGSCDESDAQPSMTGDSDRSREITPTRRPPPPFRRRSHAISGQPSVAGAAPKEAANSDLSSEFVALEERPPQGSRAATAAKQPTTGSRQAMQRRAQSASVAPSRSGKDPLRKQSMAKRSAPATYGQRPSHVATPGGYASLSEEDHDRYV